MAWSKIARAASWRPRSRADTSAQPRHRERSTGVTQRNAEWLAGAAAALLATALSACASFGSDHLDHDQVDYARALGVANKRQTLMNIVSLRYADAPSFLTVSQVIAAYTFDTSGGATLSAGSPNVTGRSASINGTVAYSNHPTFTFTPTTGEEFAVTYIRPLPAVLVLPLAQSGQPIDLLLRLTVQSIGALQNSAALSGPQASGSLGFFQLIHALRRLQLAGDLSIRIDKKDSDTQVFLMLGRAEDRPDAVRLDEALTCRLLKVPERTTEIELVPGRIRHTDHQAAVVTRSMLGILSEVGAQIEVPADDVSHNRTLPTIRTIGLETRPVIIVHVGAKAPADAFVAIQYGAQEYWINPDDFDSKFAFSLLQDLTALAEATQAAKPPTITIPAN
jgi:hypothetical protein